MITLGNNVHIFARPHRREELAWCFETALGCGPARTVEYPGIDRPMLVVSFPGGGHLSIEFTDDAPDVAPDDAHLRLGAWLELRADRLPDAPGTGCANPPPASGGHQLAVIPAGCVRRPAHPWLFLPRRAARGSPSARCLPGPVNPSHRRYAIRW